MSSLEFMKICLNNKNTCFVSKLDINLQRNEKIKCTYLLLLLLLYELLITISDSVCIFSKYK